MRLSTTSRVAMRPLFVLFATMLMLNLSHSCCVAACQTDAGDLMATKPRVVPMMMLSSRHGFGEAHRCHLESIDHAEEPI